MLCAHIDLKFMVLSLCRLLGQNYVYHYAQIPVQILNKMKNVSQAQWNIFVILELEREAEAIG